MRAIDSEEFGRIARSVARSMEGFAILEITGTSIQTIISGSGTYRYPDETEILKGHWMIPLPEQNQAVDFGVEMYSRLNHNEEMPCCARCERRFVPSHTEREFIRRFGDDGQYQTEYASRSLCEVCIVDIEKLHLESRRRGRSEIAENRQKYPRDLKKAIPRLPTGKDQKALALYKAELFYRAASETEGLRIISMNEMELQLELYVKAQYTFFWDEEGRADYTVSIDSDTGQIMRQFLSNIENHMPRVSM